MVTDRRARGSESPPGPADDRGPEPAEPRPPGADTAAPSSAVPAAVPDDPGADAPHVAPLNALARQIAARHGAAPLFDPRDGGITARLLLLLETPGLRGGAGPRLVSRDNPSGTARNLRRFFAEAGLDRAESVLWNAVPFLIHAPGARNRPPNAAERAAGRLWLPPLLNRLPRLAVVVLSGRVAGACRPAIEALRPALPVLEMAHPSPVYVVTNPAIAQASIAQTSIAQTSVAPAAGGRP